MVREALLPMLFWPSVAVVHRVHEELTVVDRFVVEAALLLAPMRPEDVAEVTTIPRDAVVRIAGRLAGLGLLQAEQDGYHPVGDAARAALQQRSVAEDRVTFMTFLYLPQTDDLIAFPPGPRRAKPPLLHRAQPADTAPLPHTLLGERRAELLRDRIGQQRVAGLPPDIVDVVDDPTGAVLPAVSPAYRCRGYVRSGEDARLVLDVLDREGGQAAQWTLTGATRQAAEWEALSARARDAGTAWVEAGGTVSAFQEGSLEWTYQVDRAAAEAAWRAGVPLSEPAELAVRADDRVVVAVGARLIPRDDDAARVFALHYAVRGVADQDVETMPADAVAAATAAATATYRLPDDTLTEAQVVDHLWSDKHYRHVYALRAAKDFPYDHTDGTGAGS